MLKICFQRPQFFSFGTFPWEPIFVEMNPHFNNTHNLVIFKVQKGIFFQDHLISQGTCNKFTHNVQEFTTNHSSFYHCIFYFFIFLLIYKLNHKDYKSKISNEYHVDQCDMGGPNSSCGCGHK